MFFAPLVLICLLQLVCDFLISSKGPLQNHVFCTPGPNWCWLQRVFGRLLSEVPSVVVSVARSIVEMVSPFVRQADFSLDWMQIDAGSSLYKQGDTSVATYLIINGRLRSICNESQNPASREQHKKVLLDEYGRGDLVGMVRRQTTYIPF